MKVREPQLRIKLPKLPDRHAGLMGTSGTRINGGEDADRQRVVGPLYCGLFRPRHGLVYAPAQQMCHCGSYLHPMDVRTERAETHSTSDPLDRFVWFAAPDPDEPAQIPASREIRVQHERPV